MIISSVNGKPMALPPSGGFLAPPLPPSLPSSSPYPTPCALVPGAPRVIAGVLRVLLYVASATKNQHVAEGKGH
jgi:hypothetical protein